MTTDDMLLLGIKLGMALLIPLGIFSAHPVGGVLAGACAWGLYRIHKEGF